MRHARMLVALLVLGGGCGLGLSRLAAQGRGALPALSVEPPLAPPLSQGPELNPVPAPRPVVQPAAAPKPTPPPKPSLHWSAPPGAPTQSPPPAPPTVSRRTLRETFPEEPPPVPFAVNKTVKPVSAETGTQDGPSLEPTPPAAEKRASVPPSAPRVEEPKRASMVAMPAVSPSAPKIEEPKRAPMEARPAVAVMEPEMSPGNSGFAPMPAQPDASRPKPAPRPVHRVFAPDETGRRPIADSTVPLAPASDVDEPAGIPIHATPPPAPVMPQRKPEPAGIPIVPRQGTPAPADGLPAPRPLGTGFGSAVSTSRSPAPASPRPAPAPAPQTPVRVSGAPLLLEKVGPAAMQRGSPLIYEIIARNVTNAPLFSVRIEDEIPPGVQFTQADPRPEIAGQRLTWNVGALEPGSERRFRVELMPTAVGELNACATASFATSSCLKTAVTQPHLVLKKTGPQSVVIGDNAVFELELTNDGTGPALGVVLYDLLPAGLQHPQGGSVETDIGTLMPGQTQRITLETKAIQPGPQLNKAKAAGQGVEVCAEATVQVTQPGLQLRKDGPRARFVDREAEFDLEVFNPGNAAATNVQVIDQLPQGLEFVSATDGGAYDANARTVTWNVGTLSPGARRAMHLKVVAKAVGDFVNQAVARADRNLEARAQEQLHVDGVAALMLEVVDLDDPVEVGNESVYEIHVINTGSDACTRLQIVAVAPDGMVPRAGTGPTQARVQGQQVIFDPLDRLASKAEVTFRVRVLCKTPGDWRFRVYMTADQLRSPVLEEESSRIYKE